MNIQPRRIFFCVRVVSSCWLDGCVEHFSVNTSLFSHEKCEYAMLSVFGAGWLYCRWTWQNLEIGIVSDLI